MTLPLHSPLNIPNKVPTKIGQWEQALAMHFATAQDKKFAYGTHDCCLFVANGLYAMTSFDAMHALRGTYYDAASIAQIVTQHGANNLQEMICAFIDQTGLRRKNTSFATRGDIAMLDEGALGLVSMDNRHVMVLHATCGTHAVPLTRIETLWSVA